MAFDTKLNLSDNKFEQLSGETLNLFGNTHIHGDFIINSGATFTMLLNHGDGKVWTSDSGGTGTWQKPITGSSGTWGSITGVLSGQTDLQNALNAKLASGGTAVCATSAINSKALCGCVPSCFLGATDCANDSAKLGNQLPAYYLNTGSTIIANNGLTLSGNNIKLGGSLTGVTKINIDSGNFYITGTSSNSRPFGLEVNNNLIGIGDYFDYLGGKVYISLYNSTGSKTIDMYAMSESEDQFSQLSIHCDFVAFCQADYRYGQNSTSNFQAIGQVILFGVDDGCGNGKQLEFSPTHALRYICDYTTTMNANGSTLVTSDWVNSKILLGISGVTITANNGLTKSGTNVRFGGALTGNTSLTGAYTLNICGGTKLSTTCGYQISGCTILKTDTTFGIYVGPGAGNSATSGNANIGIGYNSSVSLNVGNRNVAIGRESLYGALNSSCEIAIGYQTLCNACCRNSDIAIGTQALFHACSGVGCSIAIGYQALCSSISGVRNVAIGFCAGANELTSDKLYIANSGTANPLICGDFSAKTLKINGSLTITGNTTTSSLKLTSVVAKTSEIALAYIKSDGTILSGTSSGGAIWGSITGVLSGQTDLQTCLNGKLASGGTAICATSAIDSKGLCGCIPNCFLGTTACANDSAKLGNQLPSYYLNTGSTALCSTIAGNALKLGNVLPAGYLLSGDTAICSTSSINSKALCGCVPASFLLSGGTAINSLGLCGCTPSCFLGITACAVDSAKLGNHLPSYYLSTGSTAACACDSAKLGGILPAGYLLSGGTAICATSSINSKALCGCVPASFLLSGGTAVCATCAGNASTVAGCTPSCFLGVNACAADSAKLNNKSASYYLNTGSTALCATTAINSLALCGCVPSCFLGATATACCAVTATNSLCLNSHTEANLSVNNSACINGHTEANLSVNNSTCFNGHTQGYYLLSGGTAICSTSSIDSKGLCGCTPSCFLGITACANDSAKLNNKSASYYLNTGSTITCAADSAKLNNKLPAYYLNTGSTAICATCAGNASTLVGCTPSCFLGVNATAVCATCAIGAKNLCGCVPASFLLSGGTAICSTCAGNSSTVGGCTPSCFLGITACATDSAKLGNHLPAYYLNTGSTITCAADSAKLNNKLPAYYLNTGSTALCATTAGNALCLNSHTEGNLSVANSVCFNGHPQAYYLLSGGTAKCASDSDKLDGVQGAGYLLSGGTAKNSLCLGGNLANTYAPLASPSFTTCTCAPIVCATTCFVGLGAGLTGTATSLTSGCATCAIGAKNLCGCVPASFLLSGGTAVCATCAGNASTLVGCTPSCFLGATACANDSAKLGNKLPAYYLNTGSTISTIGWSNLLNGSTVAGCGTVASGATICQNTFYGVEAGKCITTGQNNVAVGFNALCCNTTGFGNIALGSSSLYNNISGANNVGVGINALRCNIVGGNNIAIGGSVLYYNTSGSTNIALGQASLQKNTIGCLNIALGNNSLMNNISGCTNIALGTFSLYCNTSGCQNIAIGSNALQNNTSGINNIALGSAVLLCNTKGCNNIALGCCALYCNTSGSTNIALGLSSLCCNTIGCYNIALGYQALGSNSIGSNNIALGNSAFLSNTCGCNNIVLGNQTLSFNRCGCNNIALGTSTLFSNTIGSTNIVLGYQALLNNTIGSNNIALGYNALCSNITGSTNVAIGCGAGASGTGSNKLYIANSSSCSLIYGEFDNKIVRINGCMCIACVPASTSETTVAYIKSDGTILSGTTTTQQTKYTVIQVSHGFNVGNVIKSSGANTYVKATGNTATNAEVVGIVTVVNSINSFTFVTQGVIETGVPIQTAGTVMYLSPTSGGTLTITEPTTAGQVSKPLMVVLQSGSKALFQIFRGLQISPFTGYTSQQNRFTVSQTSHGLSVGNIIKPNGINVYVKATGNTAANAEVVGIVTIINDANTFTYVTQGIIETGVPVQTAGTVMFLSPTSGGTLTITEPTTIGQISKPLLVVLQSGTRALFQIFRGLVITADGSYAPIDSPTFLNKITTPIVYGGTGTTATLTLKGTSSGTTTSSCVLLQPTGGKVGIGTTTPNYTLDVNGTIGSSTGSINTINIGMISGNAGYAYVVRNGQWGIRDSTVHAFSLDMYNASSPINALTVLQSGKVGIGTVAPVEKLEIFGGNIAFRNANGGGNIASSTGILKFYAQNGNDGYWTGIESYRNAYGNDADLRFYTIYGGSPAVRMAIASNGNVSMTGSLAVTGAVSKGSGSFNIPHPLESLNKTHRLVHSFIEGPQADLIYSGKVNLINGKAIINLDEVSTMTEGTFVLLCREIRCFTTNESGWDAVKGSVVRNILTIISQNPNSTDEISWMVIGERKDEHIMKTDWTDENGKVIVEPLIKIDEALETKI